MIHVFGICSRKLFCGLPYSVRELAAVEISVRFIVGTVVRAFRLKVLNIQIMS